jgi:osmotically-inducible protein OsmY
MPLHTAVTRRGIVSNRKARRLAEAGAHTVSGVRDVDNQLHVRERGCEVRRAA